MCLALRLPEGDVHFTGKLAAVVGVGAEGQKGCDRACQGDVTGAWRPKLRLSCAYDHGRRVFERLDASQDMRKAALDGVLSGKPYTRCDTSGAIHLAR